MSQHPTLYSACYAPIVGNQVNCYHGPNKTYSGSMSPSFSTDLPQEYPQRVKRVRELRGLTQARLAELIGVSFTSVNRWENGQSRPSNLSWKQILELEKLSDEADQGSTGSVTTTDTPQPLDFTANPEVLWALAEAHRLSFGHLFNPAYASETSRIEPLPHQRIAVYKRMLGQSPLRYLLADDAGAGKTIMTGLYIREMIARRLIGRVLIVPPAGLVGNWERELRVLLGLQFRVVSGSEGRLRNPFEGQDSDQIIVSVDTLATERMFGYLGDPSTRAYDLVVFDEAHKLSANRRADLSVDKTDRYRLAEAIAGNSGDDQRWSLPWSAQHLLLLTATPHMGRDFPYYSLWRLLLPDALSTSEAFTRFPADARQRHFIRRAKEEMVHYDGRPLYPMRRCDTLSYSLTQGAESEQALYDATTDYLRTYYNRAKVLNRSAARLAMTVFQRRLASSTFALLRSFERRLDKLSVLIDRIRDGSLSEESLTRQQQSLQLRDVFETETADEQPWVDGETEQEEDFEEQALGGLVGITLAELEDERSKVQELLLRARTLYERGEESKFEKLQEVLRNSSYSEEKLIIFTEHRDTAQFLVRRLEGLGFTGQVATIHGGMPYQERERQVENFRRPASEEGARFLVATDAAGEGINLQFCWLMINYDIPWNPARLEQRMGRIHRYGQSHDPVIVINLVAAATREGRVLKTLLDKLTAMRDQLNSDKVFDVIGRLFEGVSIKDYLEQSLNDGETDAAVSKLEGLLTEDQVRAIQERERSLFGEGGDVRRELAQLNDELDQEDFRRLLPGYVRRFVEKVAPLLDLSIDGNLEAGFRLVPTEPRALDPLLPVLEAHSTESNDLLTVYRSVDREGSVWIHPGEPVFDRLSSYVMERFGLEGLRGSVFVDPHATEPYLFHLARISVLQVEDSRSEDDRGMSDSTPQAGVVETRLVGLRQSADGSVEEWPVEHLLLLRGAKDFAPGSEPLAAKAVGLAPEAKTFVEDSVLFNHVEAHRARLIQDMDERIGFVSRGFDFLGAELAAVRARLNERINAGDGRAERELERVRERQRGLTAVRNERLRLIRAEPETIKPGEAQFLVHALVAPSHEPEEIEAHDEEVEAIAMRVATAYEERFGATVRDVSRPDLARLAGLPDWPGFDLKSSRPQASGGGAEELAVEVKGRSGYGSIELTDNEWARACNLREGYWLYVVFDCATPHPRLARIRDPFGKLIAKSHQTTAFTITAADLMEAAEPEEARG